ncbi:uncharacterized protein LTHEOB_6015 [Lasiodiplodia theobromae]|uniref:uncharacterized protein n=1 Tax=Lasiodiplodia theobromae TaxID=45133 RepID=UPI0015C40110|nr:uncharacterized protein LTHEOB_6015 [Lasiodiplodia theobromae]KAF4544445.1 hypothetical protein LTHEOB_6015 [Lasiodiplodia theobromae]
MPPQRSRTVDGSCWRCKKRRVLCDLKRPCCSRCIANQHPCDYSLTPLKWIDGVAARGKLAGRSEPFAPPTTTPTSETIETAKEMLRIPRPIPPPMTDGTFLRYFSHAVVPRFNLGIDDLDIDLAQVSSDPALQHAVVAISNAHHALDTHVTSHSILQAKGRARLAALEVFRKQLAAERVSSSPELLFIANVFHCVLDGIIDPGDEAAAMACHFQGGKALLSHGGCLTRLNSTHHRLSSFAVSIFATMDLVHSLLTGQSPFFDEDWVMERAGRPSWWGCLSAEDPFLGVLSTLFRLASLGSMARDPSQSVPIDELLSIQSALEKLDVRFFAYAHAGGGGIADKVLRESWAAFCGSYRATASIYMYRALCNLDSDHELVQEATRDGVRAICKENLTGNIAHCMLFPVLVIGSHCSIEADRRLLLKTLKTNATYLAFGSIQLMEQFLQQRWDCESGWPSADWWECFEGIAFKSAAF